MVFPKNQPHLRPWAPHSPLPWLRAPPWAPEPQSRSPAPPSRSPFQTRRAWAPWAGQGPGQSRWVSWGLEKRWTLVEKKGDGMHLRCWACERKWTKSSMIDPEFFWEPLKNWNPTGSNHPTELQLWDGDFLHPAVQHPCLNGSFAGRHSLTLGWEVLPAQSRTSEKSWKKWVGEYII